MASTASLLAVAASLKQSAGGMAAWSVEDLTLGLYRLSLKHAAGKDFDAIPGDVVRNRADLEEILHWLRWAMSAYETDTAALATHLRIPRSAIHSHVGSSSVHRPAHFVAVDEGTRCVVVGVRGTSHAADVLTDLCSHAVAFADGHAHAGMLEAAKWVAKSQVPLISHLLAQNPGYSLVTVGHSLGAGTAALLAMLLRLPPSLPSLSLSPHLLPPAALSPCCWAFACPSIVSQDLAETAFFIRTVVLQDDIVPRMSTAALSDLRNEILSTDWAAVARDNPAAARLVSLASSTQSALESSLGISQGQLLPTLSTHAASFLRSVSAPSAAAGAGRGGGAGAGAAGAAGAGWLAFAGRVAASVSAAVETQAKSIPEAPAAAPIRLVAPGQLYHILRRLPASLQQQFNLPPPQTKQQLLLQQQQELGGAGLASQGGNAGWLAAQGGLTPSGSLTGSGRATANGEEQLFVEEETDMETRGIFEGDMQQGRGNTGSVSGEASVVVSGPSVSHVVVRGFDPKSRFSRIILSNTLLADHSCKSYGKGIIDAMQWCS